MLVKTKENRPYTNEILSQFNHLNSLNTERKFKYLNVNKKIFFNLKHTWEIFFVSSHL